MPHHEHLKCKEPYLGPEGEGQKACEHKEGLNHHMTRREAFCSCEQFTEKVGGRVGVGLRVGLGIRPGRGEGSIQSLP